jgi:hypothetical protein
VRPDGRGLERSIFAKKVMGSNPDGQFFGERPYLSTKIITLSEFFNFVHQVSRL